MRVYVDFGNIFTKLLAYKCYFNQTGKANYLGRIYIMHIILSKAAIFRYAAANKNITDSW